MLHTCDLQKSYVSSCLWQKFACMKKVARFINQAYRTFKTQWFHRREFPSLRRTNELPTAFRVLSVGTQSPLPDESHFFTFLRMDDPRAFKRYYTAFPREQLPPAIARFPQSSALADPLCIRKLGQRRTTFGFSTYHARKSDHPSTNYREQFWNCCVVGFYIHIYIYIYIYFFPTRFRRTKS